MKKMIILIVGFFILFSGHLDAQCKIKKFPKAYLNNIKSDDCTVKPEISTELRRTLFGFSTGAAVCFSKSGEDYYLYFEISRDLSSKFEIRKNNSLELFFSNGKHIALMPSGNFRPKALPLDGCHIGCFFSVNREQIKQVADNGRVKSFILHISADKAIPSAQTDKDGSMFFEYEILSDQLGNNLSDLAACILTK